jgi:alpha-1,3-rhamnosyltransferase
MKDLCSVCCVSFNHEKFIEAGIQSIFDQTYRKVEIIILDDGSTDESVDTIKRKLTKSPFSWTLIEQENSGNVPKNVNQTIREASGEFVTVMSLDDVLLPNCLGNASNKLVKNDEILFAANSGHYEIDALGKRLTRDLFFPKNVGNIISAQDLLINEYESLGTFFLQGQVFRRDALLAIGGYDEDMIGDDIILRTKLFRYMAENPWCKFSLGKDVVFAYRKHENNLHKKTLRQIKTIIEWKARYFPEKDYPPLFYRWLNHFFRGCIRNGNDAELRNALNYHEVVLENFLKYSKTWPYRRNKVKHWFLSRINRLRSF